MDNFEVTYHFRQESKDLWISMFCEVLYAIYLTLDDGFDVSVNIKVKEGDNV